MVARVTTPKPPMKIPSAMTEWPKGDQYVAVSTTVKPVTQTAEIAVKRISMKGARSVEAVAMGSARSEVIKAMSMTKTINASRAGE